MRLRLLTADARKIVADVQFVKHFDGLIGGAESALDGALNGRLRPTLVAIDSNRFMNSQLVHVSEMGAIGSRNLLVLNLGEIRRFTLGDLRGAIVHATGEALKHGFETLATPVIGISEDVGLPIERAYRVVLQSIISTLSDHVYQAGSTPSITDVIIFDHGKKKVNYFSKVTKDILAESDVRYRQLSVDQYDIQFEKTTKSREHKITINGQFADSTPHVAQSIIKPVSNGRLDKPEIVKVLYLAANPTDTQSLRLDEEIREIDTAFRQAEYRNRFDIRQHWAVRVIDLQSHLLRHQPNIVHFSGHGSTSSSIILEDSAGKSHPVLPRALSQLFSVLKDNIRCVVLNACYSEKQAKAIAEHIDCVIGMSSVIGDKAAISFAAAFYHALGYGRDIKTAFELGCIQIDLESLNEQDTPKLLASRVDPKEIRFVQIN